MVDAARYLTANTSCQKRIHNSKLSLNALCGKSLTVFMKKFSILLTSFQFPPLYFNTEDQKPCVLHLPPRNTCGDTVFTYNVMAFVRFNTFPSTWKLFNLNGRLPDDMCLRILPNAFSDTADRSHICLIRLRNCLYSQSCVLESRNNDNTFFLLSGSVRRNGNNMVKFIIFLSQRQ